MWVTASCEWEKGLWVGEGLWGGQAGGEPQQGDGDGLRAWTPHHNPSSSPSQGPSCLLVYLKCLASTREEH